MTASRAPRITTAAEAQAEFDAVRAWVAGAHHHIWEQLRFGRRCACGLEEFEFTDQQMRDALRLPVDPMLRETVG